MGFWLVSDLLILVWVFNILVTDRVTVYPANTRAVPYANVELRCRTGTVTNITITYQWYHIIGNNSIKLPNQTDEFLIIHQAIPPHGGQYYCTATRINHCTKSELGTLIVDGKKLCHVWIFEI